MTEATLNEGIDEIEAMLLERDARALQRPLAQSAMELLRAHAGRLENFLVYPIIEDESMRTELILSVQRLIATLSGHEDAMPQVALVPCNDLWNQELRRNVIDLQHVLASQLAACANREQTQFSLAHWQLICQFTGRCYEDFLQVGRGDLRVRAAAASVITAAYRLVIVGAGTQRPSLFRLGADVLSLSSRCCPLQSAVDESVSALTRAVVWSQEAGGYVTTP